MHPNKILMAHIQHFIVTLALLCCVKFLIKMIGLRLLNEFKKWLHCNIKGFVTRECRYCKIVLKYCNEIFVSDIYAIDFL